MTFLRMRRMNGESSTASRYASSISISGEPVSGEWIEPDSPIDHLAVGDELLCIVVIRVPRIGELGE